MSSMTDQEFVETIVKAIVENPEDVKTERIVDDKGVLISLMVNEADMGKIIGKGGRTVNSIRKLLHVLGAKSDERVNLKIYEPNGGEVRTPEEDDSEVTEEKHSAPAHKDEEAEDVAEVKEDDDDDKKKDDLDDVPSDVLV
jgi:predicted RNA-binding protein YlqC (UPF0109 family)